MRFDIDLEFSADLSTDDGENPAIVRGKVQAAGQEIHITTDNAALFGLGSRKALPAVKELAEALAKRGVIITVSLPEGTCQNFICGNLVYAAVL